MGRGTLLLALWLGLSGAQGDGPALAVGTGSENLKAARLAWQRPWSWQTRPGKELILGGYHSLSLNHWWNAHESISALGYSPVFTLRHARSPWSLRLGIGAAWLSDTRIAGRELSTRFQFEDQFGIGWRNGAHDLALVYMHYSNAGIEKPNQGIDLLLLSYALALD